ncbi:MAG: ATP-binding protein [Bacilli bacterium]
MAFVNDSLAKFNSFNGFSENISQIMKTLCEKTLSKRAIFYMIDYDRKVAKIFSEYSKDKKLIGNNKEIPLILMKEYFSSFDKRENVLFTAENLGELTKLSDFLKETGVESFFSFPLICEEKVSGFVILENPCEQNITLFSNGFVSLAYSMSEAFAREKDHNELKLLNEQLKEKEEEYQHMISSYETALEEAKLFVLEYDVRKDCLIVVKTNTEFYSNYFKKGQKEFYHPDQNPFDFIAEGSVQEYKHCFDLIRRGTHSFSKVIIIKDEDLNEVYLSVSFNVNFDKDGNPISATGIGRDETLIHGLEKGYGEFKDTYEKMSEDSSAIAYLNLSKNQQIEVRSYRKDIKDCLSASNAQDMIDVLTNEIYLEKPKEKFRRMFSVSNLRKRAEIGNKSLEMEIPLITEKKEKYWFLVKCSLSVRPSDSDYEAILAFYNITDKKKMNEIESRLINKAIEYIATVNQKTQLVKFYKTLGTSSPGTEYTETTTFNDRIQYISDKYLPTMETKEKFYKNISLDTIIKKLSINNEYSFIYTRIDHDGSFKVKKINFLKSETDEDEILFYRTDITDSYISEKKNRDQLRQAIIEAQQAYSSKLDFVARVSHDIRTPVGIITNMAKFALQDINDPEKVKEDIEKIQFSNNFLLSLIDDVVEISTIDSGKCVLQESPYYSEDFIKNITTVFTPLMKEKNISFKLTKDIEVDAISIDTNRLNEIMLILFSNSIKYTLENGHISFDISTKKNSQGLYDTTLTLTDDGIGMSDEFQSMIFTPFKQDLSNPDRDKNDNGIGLGLTIVKRLVDLMSGKIKVESKLRKGTKFTIEFHDLNGSQIQKNENKNDEKLDLGIKVLLVEDNLINQEIAKRMLMTIGVTCVIAGNGQIGFETFKASKPEEFQAVLMDIQMPVMNGYESTEAIRGLERMDAKVVPIIGISADAYALAVEHGLNSGMNAFITKPLYLSALRDVLLKYAVTTKENK